MTASGDSTIGAQPATTRTESAFTVFSAYSGKVYACCVSVDVAMGWARHYAARPEDLLALGRATRGDRIRTPEGSP